MNSVRDVKQRKVGMGTMTYQPTDDQLSTGSFAERISDFAESIYWMYYIHLPFYLMTSFDAFCLHTFFLAIFTLSLFGFIKYIFL
ncbi:LAMI_0C05468g1_1 [Lachancea mirantina]|uniref:LAMI_0C05468g1_1 n=1 Tax=Lachancea mirantina TaxID=1230905 RepID=A0A1G4J2K7_9SACH|nr:LAMI_0C05468g1_1 [Lachancea mirantina]